jgi:hypothetical protein
MFIFVFLFCVVLYGQMSLRRADHSSKGVLPNVLIRVRNLRCEVAKVIIMVILYNEKHSWRRRNKPHLAVGLLVTTNGTRISHTIMFKDL